MTRSTMALALILALAPATQAAAEATPIDVRKTSGCGCCLAWMQHLRENGFAPTGQDLDGGALMRFKFDRSVPKQMISCHTAIVDGYVIEGHVPAEDIRRLLQDRPDAWGLAVPEMPLGSPGMDHGSRSEAYDVFLVREDGSTAIFASYSGT